MSERHFKCSCTNHSLVVTKLENDTNTYFSFWKYGHSTRFSRLKYIWTIIKRGHPYIDEIILTSETVKTLKEIL